MKTLYLIFNVLALSPSIFLQDDESSSTSAGSLAGGLENLDKSLVAFSSELSNSLKALGLKLDDSLSSSSSALASILTSEIQSKHSQLSEINSEIHYLLKSTNGLYNKCGGHRTCEACKYNPLCVWCDIEQICVGGDSDGPFHGECSFYSYQACFTNGCRAHNRCHSCVGSLSCGWCLNGGACTDEIEGCEHVLFVHSEIPGSACPVEEVNYPEVYISNNPTGSENLIAQEAQQRVVELRSQSVKIVQEIQGLELAKAKLIAESAQTQSIQVPGVQVEGLNADLKNKVNTLAKKEAEEIREGLQGEEDQQPKLPMPGAIEVLNSQGMEGFYNN